MWEKVAINWAQTMHKLIGIYSSKFLSAHLVALSVDTVIFSFHPTSTFCDLQLATLQLANCKLHIAILRATLGTGQRGYYKSHPFEPNTALHLEPTARGVIVSIGHSLSIHTSAILF